jgi:hypothetical protein
MNRILMRGVYGAAPIVVLGAVALISGGGRHRALILAVAVLLGVVLAVTAKDPAAKGAVRSEASAPPPERVEAGLSPLVTTVPQAAGDRDTP